MSQLSDRYVVPLTAVTGLHAWAETVAIVFLALVLLLFHRTYRRSYLLYWGLSWLALATYFMGGTVADDVAQRFGRGHPVRLALGTLIVTGGYWQVVWLLIGLWEFGTGRTVSKRLHLGLLAATLAFSAGLSGLLAALGVAPPLGFALRVGLRAGIAGTLYLGAAVLVLRVRHTGWAFGTRLMSAALLAFGLQQYTEFARLAGLVGDPTLVLQANMVDLLVQGAMGLAMVIWLLEAERQRVIRASEAQACVYRISEAVRSTRDLPALFGTIHSALGQILPARNFYIALFDAEAQQLSFPYFVDERDESPTAKPLGKGLTEYVLRTRVPLLATPRVFDELVARGECEPILSASIDWLGAPLLAGDKAIGVIALQTYDPRVRLRTSDRDMLVYVSEQVAAAITAKRAEEAREALIRELEARNAQLERFTYTVSHDLRSPLITIRGFAGLVEKALEAGDTASARRDLARVSDAASRMDRLLKELLELSRIGRIANPTEVIDFGAVAEEAVAMMHGQLAERGVAVEVQPGLPFVYGDRVRILEVVQNLLENGVNFTGSQTRPRLEIGARESGEGWKALFVRDNGIGIEARFHERIFGLFDKLDAASPGTGVGLALARRIVEVHGGQIWVESEGPGRGSCFVFTLPTPPPQGA